MITTMLLILLAIVFVLLFGNRAIAKVVPPSLTPVDRWDGLAIKYTSFSNLRPEEVKAIIMIESSGNPASVNPLDPSYGLMGITRPIGRAYAGVSKTSQLFDPEINVQAGSRFLSDLKRKYQGRYPGEWVQAYNLGETKFLAGERVPAYQARFEKFTARFAGGFQEAA